MAIDATAIKEEERKGLPVPALITADCFIESYFYDQVVVLAETHQTGAAEAPSYYFKGFAA
jgi:hypothetical protein